MDEFSQGVPFDATPTLVDTPMETVSDANGDASPLRFAKADTEIWRADTAFGTRIAGPRSVALLMLLGAGWLAVKIKDGAVAAITAATVTTRSFR